MATRRFGSILDIRGRFVARYHLGKRSFQQSFPRTRKGRQAAKLWLAEEEARILKQRKPPAGASCRAYIRRFMPHYRDRLRPSTWKTVSFHLEEAIEHFGKKPLAEVGRKDARAFLAKVRKDREVSPATIRRYAASLSAVFSEALEEGRVQMNPFARLRLPKPDRPTRAWPDFEQAGKLVRLAPLPIRPFAELVLETGLRLSEAASLLWTDVMATKVVVRSELAKSHREREVPLTARAKKVLYGLRRDRIPPLHGTDPIFPHGADFYGRAFSQAMKARGHAAVTIHTLRHVAASRIVNSGITIDVAQEWLGHASIETTRIYVHTRKGALQEAARILDALEKSAHEPSEVPEASA